MLSGARAEEALVEERANPATALVFPEASNERTKTPTPEVKRTFTQHTQYFSRIRVVCGNRRPGTGCIQYVLGVLSVTAVLDRRDCRMVGHLATLDLSSGKSMGQTHASAATGTPCFNTSSHLGHSLRVSQARIYLGGGNRENAGFAATKGWREEPQTFRRGDVTTATRGVIACVSHAGGHASARYAESNGLEV